MYNDIQLTDFIGASGYLYQVYNKNEQHNVTEMLKIETFNESDNDTFV